MTKKDDLKFDKRNYRKHNDRNKQLIEKSLKECGAGRSIVVDSENEIIAGNGVFEQAKKLNMPIKVVETDGNEVIAVKRTDLATNDATRTKLAILDNSTSDTSEFDYAMLEQDFPLVNLMGMGIDPVNLNIPQVGDTDKVKEIFENLPDELLEEDMNPEGLEKIVGDDTTATERVVINFTKDELPEVEQLLGMKIEKIVYDAKDIFQANGI